MTGGRGCRCIGPLAIYYLASMCFHSNGEAIEVFWVPMSLGSYIQQSLEGLGITLSPMLIYLGGWPHSLLENNWRNSDFFAQEDSACPCVGRFCL